MPKFVKKYWRWMLGLPVALVSVWVLWTFFSTPRTSVRVPIRVHHSIGDAFQAAKYWLLIIIVLLIASLFIYLIRGKDQKHATSKDAHGSTHDAHPKDNHPKEESHGGGHGGGHGHGHGAKSPLEVLAGFAGLCVIVFAVYWALTHTSPRKEYQVSVASPTTTSKEDPCDERVHAPKKYTPYLATRTWSTANEIPLPDGTRSCLMHLDQLDIRCRSDDGTDEDGWGTCKTESMRLQFRARAVDHVSTGAWYLDASGNEVAVE